MTDIIRNIPISEELKIYWESQNLPFDGGANEKFNTAKIGNYLIKYPNFNGEALVLHDINHLITGYETTWKGECEVGLGKYQVAVELDILALGYIQFL